MTLFPGFNFFPVCISFTMYFDIAKSLMLAANRFTTWYTEEAIMIIKNCFYRVIFGPRGIVLYPIFHCSIIFSATFLSRFFPVRFTVRIFSSIEISAASVLILFAIFIGLQLLSRAVRELAKTTRHGIEVRLMVNIAAA